LLAIEKRSKILANMCCMHAGSTRYHNRSIAKSELKKRKKVTRDNENDSLLLFLIFIKGEKQCSTPQTGEATEGINIVVDNQVNWFPQRADPFIYTAVAPS
jgi:hypothetical protein